MKLGILSDTHDHLDYINKAVKCFKENGVDLVLHAGDYVAPFSLKPLAAYRGQFMGVRGNNDGEVLLLEQRALEFGLDITRSPKHIEVREYKILLMHEPDELDALIESQQYDLIVYGHLHRPAISQHKRTLVVNPGECGGWLYGKSSVALVSLVDKQAHIVELKPS